MAGLANSYLVEIEFPTSAVLGNGFVLDSATLGLLDGTTKLGGKTFYDVTNYVREISINRGRSRQLDSFNAGQASVTFNNNTRVFDPTNTAGLYYGGLVPRQRIRITANSTYVFFGFIDDWNLDYSQPTMSLASATCIDYFSVLSTILLNQYSATYGERADQRIQTILGLPEVTGFAPTYSLDTATQYLTDDLIADQTNLLDYLKQITQSESGYLFMDATNTLRFKARGAPSTFASATTANTVIFTDSTPASSLEIKYSEVSVQFGSELLYNRVNVQNVDSLVVQSAQDTDSQTDYQVRTLDYTSLLLDTDENALVLANYILSQYSRPVFRYDSITVSMQGLSTTSQNYLLALELGSLIKVTRSFSTGTPTSISQYAVIEGVEHTISTIEHTIKYSLSQNQSSFRLDSTIFGNLDSNALGS